MWHTPGGDRSFTGPYSLLLAYGLSEIIERLTFCYEENDDDHRFGYKAFASLTLEQKAWTIHQVAFGLLDEKTPIVPLVAFNEAAIASIFPALEDLVSMEIDSTRETPPSNEKEWRWCHAVRRAIHAFHKEDGGNSSESLDGDPPLTVECDDIEMWRNGPLDRAYDLVLWDGDYDDDVTVDSRPEITEKIKNVFGINDDYYSSIPDDPKPSTARKLLKEADRLCDRIIEQADRILQSDPPA